MAGLSRKRLREHEDCILKGLADFYYEGGFASEDYRDESTGGVYEHKLANRLGFKLTQDDRSPPEFLEACRVLELNGFVRRLRRSAGFPELGI